MIFGLLFCGFGALASAEERYRIAEISVEGLDRTRPHIVRQELLFEEGDTVRIDAIEESVQRVRNLEIFDTVEYELEAVDDAYRLHIIAAERWTILPILQFSFGGDVTRIKLGLYDLNVLGRHFEVGGEYRYIAGTHSFGAWFYEPRFFGRRLRFELESWRDREVFFRYDDDGETEGGFMRKREFLRLGVIPELSPQLRLTFGARLDRTRFDLDGVPETAARAQAPEALMDLSWVGRLQAGMIFGRLDRREYLQFGQELAINLEAYQSIAGASVSHLEPNLRLLVFRELPWKSNLGLRFEWRATTSDQLGFFHYVGGLDHVRGYRYSRFNGRTYWNANAEYRIPSLDHSWLAIQHVVFLDALTIGDDLPDLATLTGASAGIGIRLIAPRIYGLILRFDFAYPVGAPGQSYLSIGSLQFF